MPYIRSAKNEIIAEINIDENATRRVKLMEEDSITVKFTSTTNMTIPVGSYIDLSNYGLWRFFTLGTFRGTHNANTGGFDYEITLHNHYMRWRNKIFKYLPQYSGNESSWVLTDAVSKFGEIIKDNLTALGYTYNGVPFEVEVDNDVEASPVTCTFSSTSILDALTAIAEAARGGRGCDWWVDEEVIHFGAIENHRTGTPVVELSLEGSVGSMTIDNGQDSNATRIYAYGSDRNITKKYRKELRLYPTEQKDATTFRDPFRKIDYSMFDLDAEDYTEQAVSNDLEVALKSIPAFESTRTFSIKSTEYTKISDAVEASSLYKVQVKEKGGNDYFTAVTLLTTNSLNISNISCNIVIYSKKNGNYSVLGTIPLSTSSVEQLHAGVVIKLNIDSNEAEYSIEKGCEVYYSVEYKFTTDNSVDTIDLIIGTMQFVKRVVTKHLELDCYDNEGNSLGEIDAILNPEGKQLGDDDSTWISASLPQNTAYFFAEGIIKSKTKAEWYTSKTTAETAVNAVVNRRLMLPEEAYYIDSRLYNSIINGSDVTIQASDIKSESELIADGYAKTTHSEMGGVPVYWAFNHAVAGYFQIYDGHGYVDREYGMLQDEIVEEVNVFEDICPSFSAKVLEAQMVESTEERVDGELTGNTLYVWHIRTDITNFSNQYRIDDTKEFSVTFSSGKLNGMTFDVVYLASKTLNDPEGKCWFEIIRNEDYAVILPNDIFTPEPINNEDVTFNLFNFDTSYIDDSLVGDAEKDLLVEILNIFSHRKRDNSTYTLNMSSEWVYNNGNVREILLGQQFTLEGYFDVPNRVIGIESALDYPYDRVVLTLGKTSPYSRFGDLQKQIDSLAYKGTYYENRESTSKQASATGNYLSKDKDDTTPHHLTMGSMATTGDAHVGGELEVDGASRMKGDTTHEGAVQCFKGLELGDPADNTKSYERNVRGCKLYHNGSGWVVETDFLQVNKKASFRSIEVEKVTHIGGQQILTSASAKIDHVNISVTLSTRTNYRLLFAKKDADGNLVTNNFIVGDLIYCQTFNVNSGSAENVNSKYYWLQVRDITVTANTQLQCVDGAVINTNDYHCITVSVYAPSSSLARLYSDIPANNTSTPCADLTQGTSSIPEAGDEIIQFGHVKQSGESEGDAKARQGALLLAGAGRWGQAIIIWTGIGADAYNPFVIPSPRLKLSPDEVNIIADNIKLTSNGVLELGSEQLICKNNEGAVTARLDKLGNFITTGIQATLMQNVTTLAKFLERFIPMCPNIHETDGVTFINPEGGTFDANNWREGTDGQVYYDGTATLDGTTVEAVSPISNEDENDFMYSYGNRWANVHYSLDMRSAQGFINIGYLPQQFNGQNLSDIIDIILPYLFIEGCNKDYHEGNLLLTRYLRTPSRMNDETEFLSLTDLKSLVGRKMTLVNSGTGVIHICGIASRDANSGVVTPNEEITLAPKQSVSLEFVNETYEEHKECTYYTPTNTVATYYMDTEFYAWKVVSQQDATENTDLLHDNFGSDIQIN